MGEKLDRNEVIRRALAVSGPDIGGEEVITHEMTVVDASGNEREVQFVDRLPKLPPAVLLSEDES